jgi:transcriptional regulator with XRE-family HTH domain
MTDTDSNAEEFVRLMKAVGWSQKEAAARANVSEGQVSHIVNGKSGVAAKTMRALKEAIAREMPHLAEQLALENSSSGAASNPTRMADLEEGSGPLKMRDAGGGYGRPVAAVESVRASPPRDDLAVIEEFLRLPLQRQEEIAKVVLENSARIRRVMRGQPADRPHQLGPKIPGGGVNSPKAAADVLVEAALVKVLKRRRKPQ